jgi:uncharacterized membrane protein
VRSDALRWFLRGAALALGAALTIAVIYVFVLGAVVVVLVFIALLLASALEPLVDRIRTRTPLQRGATLLLVYLVIRDVLRPEKDLVRIAGDDDPSGGVFDDAEDRPPNWLPKRLRPVPTESAITVPEETPAAILNA